MPIEEKEREKIRKEAKQILDKFSKSLQSVKAGESNVVRDEDRRKEGEGMECDKEFREIMFENAPKKHKDFIIAERKTW